MANLADYDFGSEVGNGIVSIAAHVQSSLQKIMSKPLALEKNGAFIVEACTERHFEMDGVGGPPYKELFMSLGELKVDKHK